MNYTIDMNRKTVLEILKVVDDKLIYYKDLAESEDEHTKKVGLFCFQAVKNVKTEIVKIIKKNYDRGKCKKRPTRSSPKSLKKKRGQGRNPDGSKR